MSNNEYPVNPELRDPSYSKNKTDIGLPKVDNLSYTEIQEAILSNVKATINEGTVYNFDKKVSELESGSRIFDLVKLKPSSSQVSLLVSLGTWTGLNSFVAKDAIRVDLSLSNSDGNDIIGYNLWVTNTTSAPKAESTTELPQDPNINRNGLAQGTENYDKDDTLGYTMIVGRGEYPLGNVNSDGSINVNQGTFFGSSALIIKKFLTGGWLVSLDTRAGDVDAIWINYLDARNIDPQNVTENLYEEDEFDQDTRIVLRTDKSRLSSNIVFDGSLEGIITYARSLNHDLPIQLTSNDPDDWYNKTSCKSYSAVSIKSTDGYDGGKGSVELIKDVQEVTFKTNEVDCKKPQNFPITINRLNHLVNLRFEGGCIDTQYAKSFRDSETNGVVEVIGDNEVLHENPKVKLDTEVNASNVYPIDVCKLTHDINLKMSDQSPYLNFATPEEVSSDYYKYTASNYTNYKISSDSSKIEYATFAGKSTTSINSSVVGSDGNWGSLTWDGEKEGSVRTTQDRTTSLDTNYNSSNISSFIVHGLDHTINIQVANSSYRNRSAGKKIVRYKYDDEGNITNELVNSFYEDGTGVGVRNLTWGPQSFQEDINADGTKGSSDEEKDKNSYVTGHISLNTFDKSTFQNLDLTVHGLDHSIKFIPTRLKPVTVFDESDSTTSDIHRPGSKGKDILVDGSLKLDTFTSKPQYVQAQVIDSRYTDSARGLALTDSTGEFLPYTSYSEDGISETLNLSQAKSKYPTINGVPFTGDFRYKVTINDTGFQGEQSPNTRNIVITSFHSNSEAGGGEGSQQNVGWHRWTCLNSARISTLTPSGEITYVSSPEKLDYKQMNQGSGDGYGIVRNAKYRNTIGSISSSWDAATRDGWKKVNYEILIDSLGSSSTDSVYNGDNDVVSVGLLKRVLAQLIGGSEFDDKIFPGSQITSTASEAYLTLFPIGSIIMWTGKTSDIKVEDGVYKLPDYVEDMGWAVCDGKSHDGYTTVNMIGKYPIGYRGDNNHKLMDSDLTGDDVTIINASGSTTIASYSYNITTNTIGGSVQWSGSHPYENISYFTQLRSTHMPNHTHNVVYDKPSTKPGTSVSGSSVKLSGKLGGGNHTHITSFNTYKDDTSKGNNTNRFCRGKGDYGNPRLETEPGGTHEHDLSQVSINISEYSKGSSTHFSNIPPSTALIFIQKIK